MGGFIRFILLNILFIIFQYSSCEIVEPIKKQRKKSDPAILTRETYTVKSKNGTTMKVTKIGFHTKNLNGKRKRQTPVSLIKIMDNKVNTVFEEIISQGLGFRFIGDKIENENKEEEKNENKNKTITNDNHLNSNKTSYLNENKDDIKEKLMDKNIFQGNKSNEIIPPKIIKDKKSGAKKKKGGFLKFKFDSLKLPKKRSKKKLSRKEIIFSRVCKYIFYSIILFTIYVLVRKLLELLEIIEPETNVELKNVKVDNLEEFTKKQNKQY
jgi:hypothetical protein